MLPRYVPKNKHQRKSFRQKENDLGQKTEMKEGMKNNKKGSAPNHFQLALPDLMFAQINSQKLKRTQSVYVWKI